VEVKFPASCPNSFVQAKISSHGVGVAFFFAHAGKILIMPGVLSQLLGVLKLCIKSYF
jgi:UPF0716 family protein affecting phage T7 exclusion